MLTRRRAIVGAMAVLLTAANAAAQAPKAQAPTWKTYSYAEDGFSIALPADPQIRTEQISIGTTRSYTINLPDGALMIGVGHFGKMNAGKTPDAVLQDAKNGALSHSQTRLVSEKKISLGGVPGLEFDAENATAHVRAHIFVASDVVYQLVEGYSAGKPIAHGEDFFDSFRILPADKPQ